jgi:hypothetical protein
MRGESADAAELESERWTGNRIAQDPDDCRGALVGRFTDKDQRNMQLIAFRPAQ